MSKKTTHFQLDERLAADTLFIGKEGDIDIALMNDSRWPWLILIPTIPNANDLDDLPSDVITALSLLSARCSAALKQTQNVTSTNVATLSNVVAQFHQHVVGRSEGDLNWPNPVWGFGSPQPYTTEAAETMIATVKHSLSIQEI